MIKVLIAGSRSFTDYRILKQVCDNILSKIQYEQELNKNDFEIVSGNAPSGADKLGERYSLETFGRKAKLFPAEWKNLDVPVKSIAKDKNGKDYNKLAGHQRNAKMIKYIGLEGIAIYFWDGKSPGTKQCIDLAKKANIRYFIVKIGER